MPLNYPFKKGENGGFPGGPAGKNLPASAGDTVSIPCLGRLQMLQGNSACVPQLRSPSSRARALPQEKPPQWEARAPRLEKDPGQSKLRNKINNVFNGAVYAIHILP